MSDETNTPISELKYNDLKKLAAEKGLDSSGTKEELVERLTQAGVTNDADSQEPASTDTPEPSKSTGAPEENAPTNETKPTIGLSPVQERVEQQKADKALKQSAAEMKAALDKQPKVSIMIPFEVGENAENAKKIPFHVNLNGYAMDIPRGTYVDVPMQVADLIKERLESEGKIGRQWRIDSDARRQEALG
jgi:hypothetical protein